jgi:hypothetical protein
MKTKTPLQAMLVGAVITIASVGAAHAGSEIVALAVVERLESENPETTLKYAMTATRSGSGVLDVELNAWGLPAGAKCSFSPSVLRFTGRTPEVLSFTMTITRPDYSVNDFSKFYIKGESRGNEVTCTLDGLPIGDGPSLPGATISIEVISGGDVQINGVGQGGATYQIETTSSLSTPSWTVAATVTADANGAFSYIDTEAKTLPMRFYRTFQPESSGTPKTKK